MCSSDLARAVRAHDRVHLALADRERQTTEDLGGLALLGDGTDVQLVDAEQLAHAGQSISTIAIVETPGQVCWRAFQMAG